MSPRTASADNGTVNRAFDASAFHAYCDVLRHRLAHGGRLVHGGIGGAHAPVQLERGRAEAADDERPVAIRRAVHQALLVGAEIVAANEQAI